MNLSKKIFESHGAVIVTGLFSSLLASALLLDPRSVFYVDWNNHLWIMEYFGECIKHGRLPDMLNTQQLVGIPIPLFYAQKFYTLSGMLSAFLGSAVTIRGLVLLVFLLQFFQVYRAAAQTGSTRKVSVCIAVIVTWAIYPLTNLYNRNAITEFFAVAFLTCSAASFLCVIFNGKSRAQGYDVIATGLFFVAAAVTHPLTALFGGLFMGILGVIILFFCGPQRRPRLLRYFSATAFFSLLTLSPWVYLLSRFRDKLTVFSPATNAAYFQKQYFFPNSIDNILSRLSLFPLDLRSIQNGVQDKATSAPYVDAQITLPLIMLMAVFIYIGRREKIIRSCLGPCERAIIAGSAGMLMIAFIESICPKAFDWMGGFFNTLQFPYRLVTYVNLSALVVLIILAGRISRAGVKNRQAINLCLAFCIAISFSAVIQKLVHAAAIAQKSTKADRGSWAPLPFGSSSHLNELPATYYGATVYSIKDGFQKGSLSGTVHYVVRNFNVLDGARFGQVEPVDIVLSGPTLVVTNVQPFPWNHILVNGSSQYPFSVVAVQGRGAVLLPAGSYHLEFVTRIDGIWKGLNILSWVVLIGWSMLYLRVVFVKLADKPGTI